MHGNRVKIVLGMLMIASFATAIDELPEYLQVCHRNDPKMADCIMASIEKIRPYLVKGLPEIDVPPLEPLHLGDLVLVENNGNNFKITAKNVTVHGAGNFRINRLQTKDGIKSIRVELNLPNLKVDGKYFADGQLLTLPIKGSGRFNGEFINLNTIVKLDTVREEHNGVGRFIVKKININSKLEKGKLRLYDLFNGDKTLSQVVNDAINSNFNMLAAEFVPIIERELEGKFKNIADKFTSHFTYEQLLPE